jgi:NAD(P)-dependent dehydrogenase (short-subunit alcohol dehydrogenase family)
MSRLHRAPFATPVDMSGKTVLVTGAAPGSIGGETADALRAWGADVVTTTRSGGSHPLDLSDPGSVQAFVDWFGEHHDALDVLVNNAGVHLDLTNSWKQPRLTADGHEIHWRVNFLGTMQLTHLLLPTLEKTAGEKGESRIVNVVSMLHTLGRNAWMFEPAPSYKSWNAYGQSKLALVHLTHELQDRYRTQGVRSYALHPGKVYTDIATKGLQEHPWLSRVRRAAAPLERLMLLTAEQGAQTTLMCATEPGLEGGRYFDACKVRPASSEAEDRATAIRLWNETLDWVADLHHP